MTSLLRGLFAALCLAASITASAQSYPARSVRIVVTIGPGSSADILARVAAEELGKRLGQPFVVENKPGAGGNIAADLVAKSAADGYTLLLATISTHAINAAMYPSMPFDPIKDFAPIALMAANPNVLVIPPSTPANSVKDLIELAARKPGEISYASGGTGTSQHLSGELMASLGVVKLTHVPYKSTPESMHAVLSGQVSMAFVSVPVALAQVKAGKLKALGITSDKPLPSWADMPTIASQGLQGFNVSAWFGMAAPAATPAAVIETLNREILAVMRLASVREKLEAQGMEILGGTPGEFSAFIKSETERWGRIVKSAGARAN